MSFFFSCVSLFSPPIFHLLRLRPLYYLPAASLRRAAPRVRSERAREEGEKQDGGKPATAAVASKRGGGKTNGSNFKRKS